MFHILGFLLILIIAILIIGFGVIVTVIRSLFGLGKRRPSSYQSSNGEYQSRSYSFGDRQTAGSSQGTESAEEEEREVYPGRKKLFSKEEGEYVDFEEVK